MHDNTTNTTNTTEAAIYTGLQRHIIAAAKRQAARDGGNPAAAIADALDNIGDYIAALYITAAADGMTGDDIHATAIAAANYNGDDDNPAGDDDNGRRLARCASAVIRRSRYHQGQAARSAPYWTIAATMDSPAAAAEIRDAAARAARTPLERTVIIGINAGYTVADIARRTGRDWRTIAAARDRIQRRLRATLHD